MKGMTPQRYKSQGLELGVDSGIVERSTNAFRKIYEINPQIYPLLTLNHLSVETGIPYGYLRSAVGRKRKFYKHFCLKKRLPGRKSVRLISTPRPTLRECQSWISDNILRHAPTHAASYAYHPNSSPVYAAQAHTNAKWLIKVDVRDFFHAISEHQVFDVFASLGYSRLLSFELSRLCTMPCDKTQINKRADKTSSKYNIDYYETRFDGILPQGAPTSPMLSNLVMRKTDKALSDLACKHNFRYTRYADDIVFSTEHDCERPHLNMLKRKILAALNKGGFRPNLRKTHIRGPGNRLIVLGMLVHGPKVKLPKEYKDMLSLHLYYLEHTDHGPTAHAEARKSSVSKIYHHVLGKIFWARLVEPEYGSDLLRRFNAIDWPVVTLARYLD